MAHDTTGRAYRSARGVKTEIPLPCACPECSPLRTFSIPKDPTLPHALPMRLLPREAEDGTWRWVKAVPTLLRSCGVELKSNEVWEI